MDSENNVGTASAVEQARIKNIYRRGQRDTLGNRQNECLAECLEYIKPNETVNILAITGNHYVKGGCFRSTSQSGF